MTGWEAVWVDRGWRWSATVDVRDGKWQGRVRSCGKSGWRTRSAVVYPVDRMDACEVVSRLFASVMDNHPGDGARGALAALCAVLR